MVRRLVIQPLLCASGFHRIPSPRIPAGPVVAICPTCGKGLYCHGLSYDAFHAYPNLLMPNFPRVLGPMSAYLQLTQ